MGARSARYVVKGFADGRPTEVEIKTANGFRIYTPDGSRWLDIDYNAKTQAFDLHASGSLTFEPRVSNNVEVCVKR